MDGLGLPTAVGASAERERLLLTVVAATGFTAGAIPAYRAYRLSLADGLSIRV